MRMTTTGTGAAGTKSSVQGTDSGVVVGESGQDKSLSAGGHTPTVHPGRMDSAYGLD